MRKQLTLFVIGLLSFISQSAFQRDHVVRVNNHIKELVGVHVYYHLSFKNVVMKNPIINHCLRCMEESQTFYALIEAWRDIQALYENDEKVLCQFCVVLLLCYHSVLINRASPSVQNKKLILVTLISLYAQLNAIPLHKLFEALEECWQKYNEISNMLAPYEDVPLYLWVQNNWWVPIFILGFTAFSYVRWQKARAQRI